MLFEILAISIKSVAKQYANLVRFLILENLRILLEFWLFLMN
jgi:hypothetical protein